MIIEFDKLKKDAQKKLVEEHCREYDDYYEYCLVDNYEEKYDKFHVHSVQIADVFAAILEEHDHLRLVAVQFFKSHFTLSTIGNWLSEKDVYFSDSSIVELITEIPNATAIVAGLLFKGCPLVVYAKGHQILTFSVTDFIEVNDVFQSYDYIVNSADAKDVTFEPPCEAIIFFNGERVNSVPFIEFNRRTDIVVSNGQLVVADFIEDWCGNIGIFQNENVAIPVSFLLDNKTPVYMNMRTKPDGSKLCVIEQEYSIDYDTL